MDDHIEINIDESAGRGDQLKKRANGTETLVDIERGIFVNFGIPVNEHGVILVPNKPHIFIADELHVVDRTHNREILKNTVVLMAHGVRDVQDKWKFIGGQLVTDTVIAYNEYAKKEGLSKVEFLAVCNIDPITQGTGIQILEFNENSCIAYAVGEGMNVSGLVADGLVRVYVSTRGDIVSLDQLITSKEIIIIH